MRSGVTVTASRTTTSAMEMGRCYATQNKTSVHINRPSTKSVAVTPMSARWLSSRGSQRGVPSIASLRRRRAGGHIMVSALPEISQVASHTSESLKEALMHTSESLVEDFTQLPEKAFTEWGVVISTISFIFGVPGVFIIICGFISSPFYRLRRQQIALRDSLLASRVNLPQDFRDGHCYVDRPCYDEVLGRYIKKGTLSQYMVVIGARGCGKSTLVLNAASKHLSCIWVNVNRSSTVLEQVFAAIVKDMGVLKPADNEVTASEDYLATLLAAATEAHREAHPNDPGWRPLIVLEFDRKSEQLELDDGACLVKWLVTDKRCCRAILVLSHSRSRYLLPPDKGRQAVMVVEDLSVPQAKELVQKNLPPGIPGDVAKFLCTEGVKGAVSVTTRALGTKRWLDLHEDVGTVDEAKALTAAFVNDAWKAAAKDVVMAIKLAQVTTQPGTLGFHAPRLIYELMRSDPVNIASTEYLPPTDQLGRMLDGKKGGEMFEINYELDTITFSSPTHKVAAGEWLKAQNTFDDDGFQPKLATCTPTQP